MADLRVLVLPAAGKQQRQKDADRAVVGAGITTDTGNIEITSAGGTANLSVHLLLAAGKNLTGTAGSGAIDFSALTGTFKTPTGTNTLSGDTTLAAGKTLSAAAGAGALDFSGASGIFKTTTGAVTIGPGAITISGAVTYSGAGTALSVTNDAVVSGTLTVSGELRANGGIGRSTSGTLALGTDTESTALSIGRTTVATTVLGSLVVAEGITLSLNGASNVIQCAGPAVFSHNVTLGDASADTVHFLGSVTAAGTANIDFSAGTQGTFKTAVGANTLSGHVTLAASKNLTGAGGTGAVDFSALTGLFKTSQGANTLSGDVTLATNKNFTGAAGTGFFDLSGMTGLFKTSTGAVTVGPGAVTIGGGSAAVTITAGAASTWSSSLGALTLTSAAAAVWSTQGGALSVSGKTALNLQLDFVSKAVVDSTGVVIQAGAVLSATGTGNINLPNNASARFQVAGTGVSANVTAANLDTLTGGGDASSLHTHAGLAGASVVEVTGYSSGGALNAADLVITQDNGGTPTVVKADANGAGVLVNALGFNKTAVGGVAAVTVTVAGEVSVAATQFDSAPSTGDVGKPLFMSETPGKITLTAPTATGSTVQKIGILTTGSGSPKVVIQIGDAVVL